MTITEIMEIVKACGGNENMVEDVLKSQAQQGKDIYEKFLNTPDTLLESHHYILGEAQGYGNWKDKVGNEMDGECYARYSTVDMKDELRSILEEAEYVKEEEGIEEYNSLMKIADEIANGKYFECTIDW